MNRSVPIWNKRLLFSLYCSIEVRNRNQYIDIHYLLGRKVFIYDMNDRTPLYIENRNSFTDRDTHIIYNLLGSYYLLYDIA